MSGTTDNDTIPDADTPREHKTSAAILSVLSAVVILIFSYSLWHTFKKQEQELTQTHMREVLLLLSNDITHQVQNSVFALKRMSMRWGERGGIPEDEWLSDARNHLEHFDFLTTVEWIDKTYHVRYVEPLEGNHNAVGLNIVFNDERKKALEGAAEKNTLTLTPPFEMVQGYRAFIGYAPIYTDGEFDGFIAGIFDTSTFFEGLMEKENLLGLNVRFSDGDSIIFQNAQDAHFSTIAVSKTLPLFNRQWSITLSPSDRFLKNRKTYLPEIALICGALFSILVAFAVFTAIVSERRNKKLRAQSLMLKHANAELEEFAYRTSHDLRSPLVSSLGLIDLARQMIESGNTEKATTSLEHSHKALTKLVRLIEDILALTQVKNVDEAETEINIEELVDEALDKFSHMENYERISFHKDLQYTQPLMLKKSRITLIVENLLSNCIKYQDPEEKTPYVKVSTYLEGTNFVLAVEDNGLGIPEKQQAEMFTMFKRFHTRVSFGSGLGLYMMKKSADILGGDIVFESPAKGSVFKVILPVKKQALGL